MRAVVITRNGGSDVLQVQQRPSPTLSAGALRIEVRAAGVNFADVMARLGLYADAPPPPSVVGYEVSGLITEIASDVTGFAIGDRVFAGTRFGGYAEEVCVRQQDAVHLPAPLTFEQGAAIPVNYGTAWAGLIGYGSLRVGEHVLIQAAAGGVGIAATQIAKRYGATVYGTASPSKHDAIRRFGVDVALDYNKRGWDRGLPPFDLVMDALGGTAMKRSYAKLRPGGRLVAYGASSVVSGDTRSLFRAVPQVLSMLRGFNAVDQMSASKTVIGLNMLRLWDDRGTLEPWITPLRALMDDGTVAPVVSDVVPFERAGEAHQILTERRNVGKVVLVP